MLGDDFLGADLRRHVEGDGVLEPRGAHHPGLVFLNVADGAGHDVAHAVDEPHLEGSVLLHLHGGGLLWDELGLGGHDGPARGGLGQLVDGPLPGQALFHVGQDHRVHKLLYEGGFPRAHRAHHPHVDLPACAVLHVFVYVKGLHRSPSLRGQGPHRLQMMIGRRSGSASSARPFKARSSSMLARWLLPISHRLSPWEAYTTSSLCSLG